MRSDLRVKLPDGTMVGYAEAGDPAGPPVMYLHGSPSSRLEVGLPGIREAAEDLGLRVLAPDRPGMGLSTFCRYSIADYPRLVRSFADALGLGRFAVTGVSGGGKEGRDGLTIVCSMRTSPEAVVHGSCGTRCE